jgi:sortase A
MKHTAVLRRAEWLAWTLGLAAIAVWIAAAALRHAGSVHELQRFAELRSAAPAPVAGTPNLALWAPERIRAWQDAQRETSRPPLAVLRVARLDIEAPVLEGTDEWALNRGVGHIEDTARPGADGNTGIAGHRDGFFRALKDITAGDVLEIETPASIAQYRVERTWIVGPDDVSVLDPTSTPSVTLVTCYPFYFVGSAPQRFIVRAVRTGTLSARAARN